jgi:hypothetical protein
MSCQDLQTIIIELARGQMTDAELRDKALSHAASCASCSIQLANQRALSAGLKRLAAVTVGEQASSRVEANLLTVFVEQRNASPAPLKSTRGRLSRSLYIGAGIAAIIAIVVLLSLTVFRAQERQDNVLAPENHSAAVPNSTEKNHGAVVQPRSDKSPEKTNPPKPSLASSKTKGGTRLVKADQSASEAEIATDFFPLTNRELTQLESGQVVRVELPRSALMSFGLPMNMDRANERIKADVVVGNDGLARAIRFVR